MTTASFQISNQFGDLGLPIGDVEILGLERVSNLCEVKRMWITVNYHKNQIDYIAIANSRKFEKTTSKQTILYLSVFHCTQNRD